MEEEEEHSSEKGSLISLPHARKAKTRKALTCIIRYL
jgi:hypothetical protein